MFHFRASTSGGKLYGGIVRGQFAMDSVKEIGIEVDQTYKARKKPGIIFDVKHSFVIYRIKSYISKDIVKVNVLVM